MINRWQKLESALHLRGRYTLYIIKDPVGTMSSSIIDHIINIIIMVFITFWYTLLINESTHGKTNKLGNSARKKTFNLL